MDDVAGVRQGRRENLNVVAGPDLADILVGDVAGLFGIGGKTSKQRVVCALEKGDEGEWVGRLNFLSPYSGISIFSDHLYCFGLNLSAYLIAGTDTREIYGLLPDFRRSIAQLVIILFLNLSAAICIARPCRFMCQIKNLARIDNVVRIKNLLDRP